MMSSSAPFTHHIVLHKPHTFRCKYSSGPILYCYTNGYRNLLQTNSEYESCSFRLAPPEATLFLDSPSCNPQTSYSFYTALLKYGRKQRNSQTNPNTRKHQDGKKAKVHSCRSSKRGARKAGVASSAAQPVTRPCSAAEEVRSGQVRSGRVGVHISGVRSTENAGAGPVSRPELSRNSLYSCSTETYQKSSLGSISPLAYSSTYRDSSCAACQRQHWCLSPAASSQPLPEARTRCDA